MGDVRRSWVVAGALSGQPAAPCSFQGVWTSGFSPYRRKPDVYLELAEGGVQQEVRVEDAVK